MNKQLPIIILISVIALTLMLVSLPIQAAPAAVPTPIAAPGAAGTPQNIVFWTVQRLTADTQSNPLQLPAYNRLDLQYTIDQLANPATGEVNTVTVRFRTSCDGQNWDSGLAIVTANAADATAVNSFANFCRYQAIYADVTNTEPVTITVIGVAKN